MIKKIISLFLVIATIFSLMIVPASAEDVTGATFWDWLISLDSEDGSTTSSFGGGGGRTADAYSDYVTDLETEMGTSTIVNGGIRLYYSAYDQLYFDNATLGINFYCSRTVSSSKTPSLYFTSVTAPYDCTYQSGFALSNVNTNDDSAYAVLSSGSASAGSTIGCGGVLSFPYVTYGELQVVSGTVFVDCYPLSGTVSDATGADVSADTRAGALTGDLMYVGDDGTQIAADDVTLFDESTGTVYNPSTNDSYNTTDWNYDYSTRTYNYTTDTGDTGTVSYGDSNASVTLTDSDGNTITYNYYYTVSSTDSGSGTDDTGSTSWWSTVLQKLADGIAAVFDLIGTVIGAIIGGLSDLVVSVVGGLTTLVGNLGQLPSAIGNLFVWLPEELQSVIGASFTVLIFAGLLKMFL